MTRGSRIERPKCRRSSALLSLMAVVGALLSSAPVLGRQAIPGSAPVTQTGPCQGYRIVGELDGQGHAVQYGSFLKEADSSLLNGRIPLVFIHGVNLHPPVPSGPPSDDWHNLIAYLRDFTAVPSRFKPYIFTYWSNRDGGSVHSIGSTLSLLIDDMEVCDPSFKDKQIAIVAHSMGGLVARSYMEEWKTAATGSFYNKYGGERVIRLLTLGTPHRGTPAANLSLLSRVFNPLDWLFTASIDAFGGPLIRPLEGNRFDLDWDNFDLGEHRGLLGWPLGMDYGLYANERNVWLEGLNSSDNSRIYQAKLFAHAGSITPCIKGDDVGLCRSAAVLGNSLLAMESDGIVPVTSAAFYKAPEWVSRAGGHAILFPSYNHYELQNGKSAQDSLLFGHIADDLNGIPDQAPAAAPAPRLISVSPTSVVGSSSPLTFTLTGSDFTATSTVSLKWKSDHKDLPASSVVHDSSTQLKISIVTGTVADTWSVQVINADTQPSSTLTFNVTAPVVANTYVLSTSASNGTITRAPSTSRYSANSVVTLTANPSAGYKFYGWSGDASGAASTTSVTMTRDKSTAAAFVPIVASGPTIASVAVGATPGCLGVGTAQWVTISGSGFANGATVLLSADGWTGRVNVSRTDYAGLPSVIRVCSGLTQSTQWTAQVVNPGEIYSNVQSFSTAGASQFTVTTSASPGNRGEVSAGTTAAEGTNVIVVASPYTGSRFVNWTEGGNYVSGERAYSFALHATRSLVANFDVAIGAPVTGSIGVNIVPAGAVSSGAGWRLAGETRWRDTGTRALNLPFNSYTIEFKPLPAWLPPANQIGVISANATDVTVTSGNYVRPQINAPSNLMATVAQDGRVLLNWQDNSSNESYFMGEQKSQGGAFTRNWSLSANATSWSVGPFPYYFGTLCYRVRAADVTVTIFSDYSNEACVTPQPLPIDPACYTPSSGGGTTQTIGRIAAGNQQVIALRGDGTVWRWGLDHFGSESLFAVQVPGLADITRITMWSNFGLALRTDGTVWAWGSNWAGQLGDGTLTNQAVPVQVAGLSGIVSIAAGGAHSMALGSDGTVWTWGWNSNGQLGDGTRNNNGAPHRVPGLSGITQISAGSLTSFALKADATLAAWGANSGAVLGVLGVGNSQSPYQLSPAAVQGVDAVAAVSAGDGYALALRQDGTVWAWGDNHSGRIGDGQVNSVYTAPFQISGLQNVVAVSAGANLSLAIRSDGSAFAWGDNLDGSVGDGSDDQPRYSPAQVIALADVVAVTSAHANTSIALRANGTVCTWGNNNAATLGDGATHLPRPVAGHVVGLGGAGVFSLLDATPDPFAFSPQVVGTPNAAVVSNSVTVSGVDSSAAVSVIGGDYSINGSAFVGAGNDAVVRAGDTVAVRVVAPATLGQAATATLTIGGVGADFTVTTVAAPDVATSSATNITLTSATLNATVNPHGSDTTALFDYGATASYGSQVVASPVPGAGVTPVAVSAAIAGLSCSTTYHFRIAATNLASATGSDLTFTTASCSGFTDDPLVAGATGIKVVHVVELRARIDALRVRFGLAAFVWTDTVLSTSVSISGVHLVQLRAALSQAYAAAGQSPPVFTDPTVIGGSVLISARHIQELRNAIVALEAR